jgi:hypothetical protein
VTMKMSDPRDDWKHVLTKVLLYGENGNLKNGLMALGINDIADFLVDGTRRL